MRSDKADIVSEICRLVSAGDPSGAADRVAHEYPFEPVATVARRHGPMESTKLFVRDGFIDRYSGTRLVFPGVLRLLSITMPSAFPYQLNWKMSETHEAYWELSPTIDHVEPIARGGADHPLNLATTSMLRNTVKSNWTLAQLGWTLHAPGQMQDWDGLLGWFHTHLAANPALLEHAPIRRWHKASICALAR